MPEPVPDPFKAFLRVDPNDVNSIREKLAELPLRYYNEAEQKALRNVLLANLQLDVKMKTAELYERFRRAADEEKQKPKEDRDASIPSTDTGIESAIRQHKDIRELSQKIQQHENSEALRATRIESLRILNRNLQVLAGDQSLERAFA